MSVTRYNSLSDMQCVLIFTSHLCIYFLANLYKLCCIIMLVNRSLNFHFYAIVLITAFRNNYCVSSH